MHRLLLRGASSEATRNEFTTPTMDSVFTNVGLEGHHTALEGRRHKVTIVGVGGVGMACAYSLLNKGIVGELVLADVQQERLQGEVLDLQHAGLFLPCRVRASGLDYEETRNSDICIITAGARQNVRICV
ncbi:hypothetical protein PTSG_11258 [Salpingoeca rosetta]|uniref:Lactate/malate dehydrogenase N-terminal domain-containing protein n=1 Tax=Salpingoeca rosetta (strain ATCC 50818 / BSB-021) TaxID=946362 RepID=F2USW2_SALR5|nr:uncharacterized protein PTSG_11258 [Salpingoeca rosetta]EGD81221.1 hypothetical protein PTSG_11258 [Salpingoeca rosetta]|eukprot:XP_004987755.1 hypothetical protein PTSG_11258 [Salpingoeca rosetta]